jgi:porin
MKNQQLRPYAAGLRLGLILAALWVTATVAEENKTAPESRLRRFLEQDYLLGDWGGLRTDLSKRGVDFEFLYAASVPSNLDGGIEKDTVYQGGLLMLLDLNSEKLAGYHGGQLHVGSVWVHGEKPFSDRVIGDLNKVNLLDFENGVWLWELWYEQRMLDDKVSLKVGQLAIDRDFIVPEYYNSIAGLSLLNQTFFFPTMSFNVFDQPFFPVGHHALASTPYGTPGVRLRFDPCQQAYLQIGAYDGNPDRTPPGARINLNQNEGSLIYFETGLKLNQSPEAQGPPGNLKLGGYYHTDDFYDMRDGSYVAFDNVLESLGQPKLSDVLAFYGLPVPSAFTNPRTSSGNYGFYFLADQTLWREVGKDDPAQQGLVGFFRAAYAPEDRNLASLGIDGGLVYRGLIPSRDWDTLALAASYLEISGDVRQAQRELNSIVVGLGEPAPFTELADYEGVIELSYKAQMTAWWTVQTSVQRVIHPGGRLFADIPDAWAFIVQTTVRF